MSADSASTISSLCPPGVTDHDPSSCPQTVWTIVPPSRRAVGQSVRDHVEFATRSRATDRRSSTGGRATRGGDRRVATRRERDADGGSIGLIDRSIYRLIGARARDGAEGGGRARAR